MSAYVVIGMFLPLVGTGLGSLLALGIKEQLRPFWRKLLFGFASGVMIAAAFFSLLEPAIDLVKAQGGIPWLAPSIGFLLGILFLLVLDTVIPHLHKSAKKPEGLYTSKFKKPTMLAFAVTLHNIPEGMAVGVAFAGALSGNQVLTIAGAFVLAGAIALHNFPEGAIVSVSLRDAGLSRRKSVAAGFGSGVVEPIAAFITMGITTLIEPILPYVLAFAAGAMIYVVVEELIPEAMEGEHSNIATIGVAAGFIILMATDLAI
ncbi:MAG: ZIP family metal transporter [Lachnospiraceae bacterium]|nr:ZIP family metal transporter [Lachnospiraceae bacterium]